MLIVIDIHIYGFAWIYNVYIYIYTWVCMRILWYVMNLYHLLTNMGLYKKTVLQNPIVDHGSSCSLLKWPLQGMFRILR